MIYEKRKCQECQWKGGCKHDTYACKFFQRLETGDDMMKTFKHCGICGKRGRISRELYKNGGIQQICEECFNKETGGRKYHENNTHKTMQTM